jgi:GT2 family glycosyltransferase
VNAVSIVIPTLNLRQGRSTGSLAEATAGCPTHLIVQHDQRRQGFTKTVNAGMAQVPDGHDICVLNDDIERFYPGWLATLWRALYSKDKYGIACPSGNSSTAPMCHGYMGMRGIEVVKQVPFWCALLKRRMVDQVGHLDPAFIHYASDSWYCYQARKAGWRFVWVKEVYLEHKQHGSGLKREWKKQDQKLYYKRVRG